MASIFSGNLLGFLIIATDNINFRMSQYCIQEGASGTRYNISHIYRAPIVEAR